jgi:hypothetical protein
MDEANFPLGIRPPTPAARPGTASGPDGAGRGTAGLSVRLDSLAGMTQRWGVERVAALAPDPAQAATGQRLATTGTWSDTGYRGDPPALWGRCQGSGTTPYRTVIDLSAPAYSCSCPSRRFPCKHALGLMFRWSAGLVPEVADPAGHAQGWLAARAEKAQPVGAEADGGPAAGNGSGGGHPGGPADPGAAAKRVAQRRARVGAGLDELDQWLGDQIRTGLSGLDRSGHAPLEVIAARMVDAQAPGVAGRLRRLPAVLASGEGWHGRLLEQYALLRLLVQAHRRLAELPAPLAAAVRTHIGYPTSRDDVLAGPPVRDTWAVLGLRDSIEDRLATRRVWLRGAGSGRPALVLSFAPPGQQLDGSLVPGTAVDADLHFYPGGIRTLVGTRHGDPGLLPRLAAGGIDRALAEYGEALIADPWTARWPVLLDAVAPVRQDGRWLVRDGDGAALPLARPIGDPWQLLAVSGGEPVTVAGEWSADGLIPLSVLRRQELVPL